MPDRGERSTLSAPLPFPARAAWPDTAAGGHRYPAVIGFTPNHWAYGWSSRRRILRGLAERGWPTVYSSGARSVWERHTAAWRTAPWTHRVFADGTLIHDAPGKLLARWPTWPLWDRVALATYIRHLRRALGDDGHRPPVALLFHPAFWPYVAHLDPGLVVYYAYDAHCLAPGWTPELAACEEKLVARADLIIAFSRGMLDAMPGDGPSRGRLLPTGVDIAPFTAAADAPCPADLAAIPRPRIGYMGRINQKLDFALVREIACRRPDWHWVFAGATGTGDDGRFATDHDAENLWRQCCALPNVHTLGRKAHDDVPAYLRHMDTNVMCYRTGGTGWWSEIFPLKSIEYLAAGRPIVSTPVKTMRPFADTMALAATADDWIGAIDHALTHGGVGTPCTRRARAAVNTWNVRIDRLHGWMQEALAGRAGGSPRETGA